MERRLEMQPTQSESFSKVESPEAKMIIFLVNLFGSLDKCVVGESQISENTSAIRKLFHSMFVNLQNEDNGIPQFIGIYEELSKKKKEKKKETDGEKKERKRKIEDIKSTIEGMLEGNVKFLFTLLGVKEEEEQKEVKSDELTVEEKQKEYKVAEEIKSFKSKHRILEKFIPEKTIQKIVTSRIDATASMKELAETIKRMKINDEDTLKLFNSLVSTLKKELTLDKFKSIGKPFDLFLERRQRIPSYTPSSVINIVVNYMLSLEGKDQVTAGNTAELLQQLMAKFVIVPLEAQIHSEEQRLHKEEGEKEKKAAQEKKGEDKDKEKTKEKEVEVPEVKKGELAGGGEKKAELKEKTSTPEPAKTAVEVAAGEVGGKKMKGTEEEDREKEKKEEEKPTSSQEPSQYIKDVATEAVGFVTKAEKMIEDVQGQISLCDTAIKDGSDDSYKVLMATKKGTIVGNLGDLNGLIKEQMVKSKQKFKGIHDELTEFLELMSKAKANWITPKALNQKYSIFLKYLPQNLQTSIKMLVEDSIKAGKFLTGVKDGERFKELETYATSMIEGVRTIIGKCEEIEKKTEELEQSKIKLERAKAISADLEQIKIFNDASRILYDLGNLVEDYKHSWFKLIYRVFNTKTFRAWDKKDKINEAAIEGWNILGDKKARVEREQLLKERPEDLKIVEERLKVTKKFEKDVKALEEEICTGKAPKKDGEDQKDEKEQQPPSPSP